MNLETTFKQYKRFRKEGDSARSAFWRIKQRRNAIDWTGDRATWTQDGFRISARIEGGDDPDLSYLGEFSDTWTEGAIKHSDSPREFKWFIPGCIPRAEDFRQKHGRHESYLLSLTYPRQDYSRACDYGNGWGMVSMIVSASLHGIELGEFSCGGIESDAGEYLDEVARDCASRAIHEAQKNLHLVASASA